MTEQQTFDIFFSMASFAMEVLASSSQFLDGGVSYFCAAIFIVAVELMALRVKYPFDHQTDTPTSHLCCKSCSACLQFCAEFSVI
jgi:hypothetical protein